MAITAIWSEYNGSATYNSPSSANVTSPGWVSTDAADASPSSFPITNNTFSFFKRQAVRFTGFAGESVSDFRLYASSGLSSAGVVTGTTTDTLKYVDVGDKTTASVPDAATISGLDMPNSLPGAANIGGGTITADNGGTNFFKHQIFVHTTSTSGKSVTLALRYSVVG